MRLHTLLNVTIDIFSHNDGVIDDDAQGDQKGEQRHHVDAVSGIVDEDHRCQKGDRNSQCSDAGNAKIQH